MSDEKLIQKVINDDFKSFTENVKEGIENLNNGVGQVAEVAQSLQRTILPNVELPDVKSAVKIPGVKVPDINDVFKLPGIKAADIKVWKCPFLERKRQHILYFLKKG